MPWVENSLERRGISGSGLNRDFGVFFVLVCFEIEKVGGGLAELDEVIPFDLEPGVGALHLGEGLGLNPLHDGGKSSADLALARSPHPRDALLTDAAGADEAEDEEFFGVTVGEGFDEGFAQEIDKRVFAGRGHAFSRELIEGVRRFGAVFATGAGKVATEFLASLEVDEPVDAGTSEEAHEVALSFEAREQRWFAILSREAIGPEVGDDVAGFGRRAAAADENVLEVPGRLVATNGGSCGLVTGEGRFDELGVDGCGVFVRFRH